jgi:hypothetical protein
MVGQRFQDQVGRRDHEEEIANPRQKLPGHAAAGEEEGGAQERERKRDPGEKGFCAPRACRVEHQSSRE